MAEHGIRHYSLEIFGIGCAVHEAQVFYPEIGSMFAVIPYFERIFGMTMALLFVVTVILWLGFSLGRIWRHWFPSAKARADLPSPPTVIAVSPVEDKSKTDAIVDSRELQEFSDDASGRMNDMQHAFNNYSGTIHELQMCFEHDEEEASAHFKTGKMSPKLIRDVRAKLHLDERAFLETLREMRVFLISA